MFDLAKKGRDEFAIAMPLPKDKETRRAKQRASAAWHHDNEDI
jgi:hypothetical protein